MNGAAERPILQRPATWVALGFAVVVVIGVISLVAGMWSGIGDVGISEGGWIAMAIGILVTLAVGVGLMALMFISSRRGYDDPGPQR